MNKKLFRLSIACLLSLFFMFQPVTAAAGPTGAVKVGLMYDPSTLNMLEVKTGVELPIILHLHEALQATDGFTGERTFENSLTEEATVMENGKDIRFKLRKGHFFHTGDPVTAHDVKFTYEQCVDPKNANLMAGPLDEIEKIEVLDDYNLVFHFYEPYAAWKELLWIGITSKKYFDKVGMEGFRKHPVGSGAFRFVSRNIGENVILEANEKSRWTEKGKERKVEFKTLEFLTVPDEISRMAMLETGELDLISDILPHQAKRLEQNKHIIVKRERTAPSLYGLSSKPDNYPIFKDANFTTAFSYAINRQEIVDKIFLGEGYPMYMFASKSELGYDPNIKFEFNPEKARELVKKSGYKPGTPIILTYTSAVPNSALVAATIQGYMKNVGVTVTLQQLEAGVQATYSRTRDKKEGHLTLYAWAGGRDPSTRLLLTLPRNSIYNNWATRKKQDQLDKLVLAQARETNPEKRLAFIKQIHQIIREEPGAPTLFGLNQIYAMRDRIEYSWLPNEAYLFNLNSIRIVKPDD